MKEGLIDSERDRIFGHWLADHKGILFKVVHAYAFEHADRQDLFQEVALQVWRSVDAFRGESSVPTWMYRVALNTAIAWTRKEDRHQRGKQPLQVVEGLLTTSSSDGRDPRVARIIYVMSAVFVAIMVAFCLFIMISDKLTGWDFAIPIVGAAAALLWPGALHVSYRAQARSEQSFGESLRDQLNRHIAQLDFHARRVDSLAYHLVSNIPTMVWFTALFFAILRINEKPVIDAAIWAAFVGMIFLSPISVAGSAWVQRRAVKRQLLPHKRRLEALLQELDAP